MTTTLSRNNPRVFFSFRGLHHEVNLLEVKPMNITDTVLKNIRQNVAVGTPTSEIEIFISIDEIEKHKIDANPPIIPLILLGWSSCFPTVTVTIPNKSIIAPMYSCRLRISPRKKKERIIVTICPSIKYNTCTFAPKSWSALKNNVSPIDIPIIPLSARNIKSCQDSKSKPPVQNISTSMRNRLNRPLKKVIPAAGISLPRRSNKTVANAQDAAEPNAANIPINSICLSISEV